jgi:polyvinyl alcohol dehydrogenase (cytochrome)
MALLAGGAGLRRGVGALTAAACLCLPAGATAAEQQAYAAAMSYATPAITIAKGDTLTFNNLDSLAKHDLVGHDGFGSELIGAGESSPVKGVEFLDPGQYQFHCTLHSWMQGTLNVTASGGGAPSPTDLGNTDAVNQATGAGVTPDPVDIWPRATRSRVGDDSWPMYGHDIANTRDGGDEAPSPPDALNMGVAWSFYSPDGDFTGTPVVADGLVIAGSFGGTVYAMDAATGQQRWAHHVDKPINATVATDGRRVFVPIAEPNKPKVLALSLRTGRELWIRRISKQPDSDVYGSPVVHHGRVYMGVSALFGELNDPDVNVRGQVVALDARTGRIEWSTFTVPEGHDGGSVWTTPAIDPARNRLYVGTGNAYHEPVAGTTDSIVALNLRTGRVVDHFQATAGDVWNGTSNATAGPDHDFGASPQLFEGPDGKALVGAGQKSGIYWALDRGTMEPAWNTQVGVGSQVGGVIGSTATDGTRVYGPNTVAGEHWALNVDGSPAWVSADGGPLKFGSTAVANGVVWTTDMSGFLIAREAGSGLPLARIPLGSPSWGGVSIAGGTVFAAIGTQGASGYIAAYRPMRGDELFQPSHHWYDQPEPNPDKYLAAQHAKDKKDKAAAKKRCRRKAGKVKRARKRCRHEVKREPEHDKAEPSDEHEHEESGQEHQVGRGGALLKANRERGDRYVPKPAGTTDHLSLYYGPYTIPPGWDANRVDLELPTQNGFLISLEPAMRRVSDLSEPMHTEAHIHHAHWFGFDPGNEEDNYFDQTGIGTHEWVFGNGDEETRADFRRRSAAQPDGPVYGNFLPAGRNQTVIYMLHNKTSQPMAVYIVLDVIFQHGTRAELEKITGRPYHDVTGMLLGRTFDVPREPDGDGKWEYVKDCARRDEGPDACAIEWVAPHDGTIIGSGGHLHPGGTDVIVENYGSEANPCTPDARNRGYGGTLLYHSDVINRNAPFSEDYQTEVTHPAWRAPLHKGDRIRISGNYENKKHAWYTAMIHAGFYFDYEQKPRAGCKPYIVGKAKKKVTDPTEGVPNRAWGAHMDEYCGVRFDQPACEHPEDKPPETAFVHQNQVNIVNFQYLPGDRSSSTSGGTIPSVPQGEKITFFNADQAANIRHSVTTCPWPCNGRYVANYPHADGAWDSGTLGFDIIDGGSPNPIAETPPDLPPRLYTYFCRIHPWMRGAFRIEPKPGMPAGLRQHG